MTGFKLLHQDCVLAVPNVEVSAGWWQEKLGFEEWLRPEGWIFLKRGRLSLRLGECPDAIPPAELGDHQYFAYVEIDNLSALRAEILARGGAAPAPIDKPWGKREMPLQTPDGHRLMFSEDLERSEKIGVKTDFAVVFQDHVLAVHDVEASAAWWREKLGFEEWLRPEGWIFLKRDAFSVMLGECPDAIAPADLGDHQYFAYAELDDVAAFHGEIVERGLAPPKPVDMPWGMREMPIETPDGHRLMFAQDLDR